MATGTNCIAIGYIRTTKSTFHSFLSLITALESKSLVSDYLEKN